MLRVLVLAALVAGLLSACSGEPEGRYDSRAGGPYRLTWFSDPPRPVAGQVTQLTSQLRYSRTDEPVHDLEILHERTLHNFIVNLDFSSFAHIHHEDFAPIEEKHRRTATLNFPYTDLKRDITVRDVSARLSTSPAQVVAGFETELVLELSRAGMPVTDLALLLGTEVHVALWRTDGRFFGHTHSYTPHMASMMAAIREAAADGQTRARMLNDMMVKMMSAPSELVFEGPTIPIHYVFPEPGVYAVFLQAAPAGESTVFKFMVEVDAYSEGMDTTIHSIINAPAHQHSERQ